jgi:hypothetical protein
LALFVGQGDAGVEGNAGAGRRRRRIGLGINRGGFEGRRESESGLFCWRSGKLFVFVENARVRFLGEF